MRVIVIESWFSCSEGGRCKRGGRRGCECGVGPVELGFLLNLYHGGAIPAVGSGMDGQNQLGHLG